MGYFAGSRRGPEEAGKHIRRWLKREHDMFGFCILSGRYSVHYSPDYQTVIGAPPDGVFFQMAFLGNLVSGYDCNHVHGMANLSCQERYLDEKSKLPSGLPFFCYWFIVCYIQPVMQRGAPCDFQEVTKFLIGENPMPRKPKGSSGRLVRGG